MSYATEQERKPLPVQRISRTEFLSLPEWRVPSHLPPGELGFRWRQRLKNRKDCEVWLSGQFVSVGRIDVLGVDWRLLEIFEG
jgi:hypothetical protein